MRLPGTRLRLQPAWPRIKPALPLCAALLVALLAAPIAIRPGGRATDLPSYGMGCGAGVTILSRVPAVTCSDALAQSEMGAGGGEQTSDAAADRARDSEKSRSRFRYLMLGYGVIWVSLGVFLISLTRKIGRVGAEIDNLRERLDVAEKQSRRS
jgi:hypothetical protein